MEVYATEHEQVEAIKRWIKENAVSTIIGVALGVAAVFGWRVWMEYQHQQGASAANEYAQVLSALNQKQMKEVLQKGDNIIVEYGRSPYSALAALAMAKADLTADDRDSAKVHLRSAMEHARLEPLGHIARQRLIRVYLSEAALDEAERLLNEASALQKETEIFSVGYNELQGDLLSARGDVSGAAQLYHKAMAGLPADSPYRAILELKRDDAGWSAAEGHS